MMLVTFSKELSAVYLLLLHVLTAADSKACSEGVCAASELKQHGAIDDAVFGQSNEVSFMQLSAMEKRAQEADSKADKHHAQKFDLAVKRKGSADDSSARPTSKGKALKDAASEDTLKDMSNDTSTKKSKKRATNKRDPWTLLGDGCCAADRDLDNGKLFGGNVTSLDACKAKCRSFSSCGMIEYGWKDMPKWCFSWADSQKCTKSDSNCKKSVPGNGKGVKRYQFEAPKIDPMDAAESTWNVIGKGCCDSPRNESYGKLYAGKEPTLDACKAKCLSFKNCGLVEYGWATGDPEWCFIWDDSQKCEKQDLDCKETFMGSGQGAVAHKYEQPTEAAILKEEPEEIVTDSLPVGRHQSDVQVVAKSEKPLLWGMIGDGCCSADRDDKNGKLWGGLLPSLDACQAQCRSFNNCGIVEYGWQDEPERCFIWDNTQTCQTRDTDCKKSVPGNGKGVKGYLFIQEPVDKKVVAESVWELAGEGCCDGLRDENNGKLYASREPDLDSCKAKCLSFDNCGVVEYGWEFADPQWCFIWDNTQQCKQQDADCKLSGLAGHAKGAKAHRFVRAQAVMNDVSDGNAGGATDIVQPVHVSEGRRPDDVEPRHLVPTDKQKNTWTLLGDGCCAADRDDKNGKLWGGLVASLDACQAKCRTFSGCGMVEYGWKDEPERCFIWDADQKCETRDPDCKKSVPGNGIGVQGYRFIYPAVDPSVFAQSVWDVVGPGCCDGLRDESNGKLYASRESDLAACKLRCLSFDNCGAVEYGWEFADPYWCFIWDNTQKCETRDLECKQSGLAGHAKGAKAHRLVRG